MSLFAAVKEAPADPILGVAAEFRADTHPKKVNLSVGAYRTDEGKPYVFESVVKVEQELATQLNAGVDKEYLPIDGLAALKPLTQGLLFGDKAKSVVDGSIASIQALSGTGALRIGGEFLAQLMPQCCGTDSTSPAVYVSDPTWGNHVQVFQKAGLQVRKYPYWDEAAMGLAWEGMKACLSSAPEGSVIVLHACAHNPTGIDPTEEQWKEILAICQSKKLFPFLDNAYQGYASGDLEKDGLAQRMFEEAGMEFMLSQSFAKNMGLYGERIGVLHVVTKSADDAKRVLSQLKTIIRAMYSSPPCNGALLVQRVLGDPTKRAAWVAELAAIAGRVRKVREGLKDGLVAKGTPGNWDHITNQIGMFSYTGLSEVQCARMVSEFHVYLLKSGRISLAGLNTANLQYVVDAMDACVRG